MRKLSSFVLARLARRQNNGGEHPDADLLAGFAEGTLLRREREAVLAHLAECAICRDVVALGSTAQPDRAASLLNVRNRSVTWWGWRIAAAAAVMCLAVTLAWQFLLLKPSTVAKNSQISTQIEPNTIEPPAPALVAPPLNEKVIPPAATKERSAAVVKRPVIAPPPSIESDPNPIPDTASSVLNAGQQLPVPPAPQVAEAKENRTEVKITAEAGPVRVPSSAAVPQQMFSKSAAPPRGIVGAMRSTQMTLWSLETAQSRGTVDRSDDGGKTWHSVPVDDTTQFYALATKGPAVWIGGTDGKLFHSIDNGQNWIPVDVIDGTTRVAETIVAIDALGDSVTLKLRSGQKLLTRDAGVHWVRQ